MSVFKQVTADYGETLTWDDTITDDGTATGTPVDITGWELRAAIHLFPGDGDAVKEYLSSDGGITITNGTAGELTVNGGDDDTVDLVAALGRADEQGDVWWYIERTDTGNKAVLSKGELHIEPR